MSRPRRDPGAPGGQPVAGERPELLILCGALGIAFPVLFTLGVLALQVVIPNHDPVTDTISDLGRGPHAVWMDTLFYVNAAGHIALGLGAAHAHLGRWAWSAGSVVLTLLALDLVMLGIWDSFGRGEGEEYSAHSQLAILLLPLYLIGPLSMAPGAARAGRAYWWLFVVSAGLWPAAALFYYFGPDPVDGLLERIAGATTLLWTIPLGWLFLARGRAAAREQGTAPE